MALRAHHEDREAHLTGQVAAAQADIAASRTQLQHAHADIERLMHEMRGMRADYEGQIETLRAIISVHDADAAAAVAAAEHDDDAV